MKRTFWLDASSSVAEPSRLIFFPIRGWKPLLHWEAPTELFLLFSVAEPSRLIFFLNKGLEAPATLKYSEAAADGVYNQTVIRILTAH